MNADTLTEKGYPTSPALTAVVIDDSATTRVMLRDILNSTCVRVIGEAANGHDAIQICDMNVPDIVLLDIVMPGMSGLQTLAAIRKVCPLARILIVSSISERNTVLESRNLGAVDYVLKPFDRKHIIEQINRVCAASLQEVAA